jgi:hypothetical protein
MWLRGVLSPKWRFERDGVREANAELTGGYIRHPMWAVENSLQVCSPEATHKPYEGARLKSEWLATYRASLCCFTGEEGRFSRSTMLIYSGFGLALMLIKQTKINLGYSKHSRESYAQARKECSLLGGYRGCRLP